MSNTLVARRNSLVLQRRSLLLKLKSLKPLQVALKTKINKQIKSLTVEIAKLNRMIAFANDTKKQIGVKPVVTPTIQAQPNFKGELQDPVFKPSVVKPIVPVVSLPSVVPTKPPVTQSPMPQFEVETFEAEVIEAPVEAEQQTMMDTYLDWLNENKLYVGLGVLIGSYFLIKGKKKPKSNPKRKRLKSKSRKSKVRKVRKNKRRSGYHRS